MIIYASRNQRFIYWLDKTVRRLSHISAVMLCLSYTYPRSNTLEILKKEDKEVTLSVIIITIVYGTASSVLATYIVRLIDKKAQK